MTLDLKKIKNKRFNKLYKIHKNKSKCGKENKINIMNNNSGWLGPSVKDATSNMIASQTERIDDTLGLLNQLGYSIIQGMGICVGVELLSELWREEKIKFFKIVEKAIFLGIDFGIKTLGVWILKTLLASGVISFMPLKNQPGLISNISYIIIENINVLGLVVFRKLKWNLCLKTMEMTTLEIILGISISEVGIGFGKDIGRNFGYVLSGAFGFLGGTIGYIVGFKLAEITLNIIDALYMREKKFRTSVVRDFIDVLRSIINGLKIIF